MLDLLFERAQHMPVWVLSLGNEVVSIEELEAKMTRLGRKTKALEIAYQHLPAVATEEKKRTNREFLVVGWDPDLLGGLLQGLSTEKSFGSQLENFAAPIVHDDSKIPGPALLALLPSREDGLDKSESTLPEKFAWPRVAVSILDGEVDEPDPFLVKSALPAHLEEITFTHAPELLPDVGPSQPEGVGA